MILFMHGLLSSPLTNKKYTNIKYKNKLCKLVKYTTLSYNEVSDIYDSLITKHKPQILIGHSMGGYWAITKSNQHNIPCIAINPFVNPNNRSKIFFKDYTNLNIDNFNTNVSLYMEGGDMLLNMQNLCDIAKEKNINYKFLSGGSHFVKYKDELNLFIDNVLESNNIVLEKYEDV